MYRFKIMIKITPKEDEYGCHPRKGEKPKKIYPHLRLRHEFFPEAKKWEVGKTYKILLEIKMTGLSISRFQNDSEFDIVAYDIVDNPGKGNSYKED